VILSHASIAIEGRSLPGGFRPRGYNRIFLSRCALPVSASAVSPSRSSTSTTGARAIALCLRPPRRGY